MSLSKDSRVSTVVLYNSVRAVVPMESSGASKYLASKLSSKEIPPSVMAYFMVQAGYDRQEIMMELNLTESPMRGIEKFLKKHIEDENSNLSTKIKLVRNHLKLNYQLSI